MLPIINNTQQFCMVYFRGVGVGQPVHPIDIVLARWPETKQPEKKVVTITQHLRRLQKLGYCAPVNDEDFVLTKAGLTAYHQIFDEDEEKSWLKTQPKPGAGPTLKIFK
jgi:hypothetical protein